MDNLTDLQYGTTLEGGGADWIDTLRSSVRPLVTLALTAAVIGLTYLGKIPSEIISTAMGTALGFYFADRAAAKRQGGS